MSGQPASCSHTDTGYFWAGDPNNEAGWHCSACSVRLGYRPDLDRELIAVKVRGLLTDLHMNQFVSVANSDHGDHIVSQVAACCRALQRFDQITVLREILMVPSVAHHADFWAAADPEDAERRERERSVGRGLLR